MDLYDDNQDYTEIINNNIQKAKLLYSLSNQDRILVEKFLNQKEKVKKENGIFANFKLKQLNKKIKKIEDKYKNY